MLTNTLGGAIVASHLQGEANLPREAEGRDAIARLAGAVPRPLRDDPVQWYCGVLRDPGRDLVHHGPEADPALPDDLCKIVDALVVYLYYCSTRPVIPGASLRMASHRPAIERWLRDWVCAPSYREALNQEAMVSGDPPVVFSTFEEDRRAKFPPGTRANECRKALGLDPRPTPVAQALFKYAKSTAGPAKVPTAFDAGTSVHFVPPPAGAPHGTTRDLRAPGAAGVREVVVRPFPLRILRQPEFIEG